MLADAGSVVFAQLGDGRPYTQIPSCSFHACAFLVVFHFFMRSLPDGKDKIKGTGRPTCLPQRAEERNQEDGVWGRGGMLFHKRIVVGETLVFSLKLLFS